MFKAFSTSFHLILFRALYPFILRIFSILSSHLPDSHAWRLWNDTRGKRKGEQAPSTRPYLFLYCDSIGEWESMRKVLESLQKNLNLTRTELCFFSPTAWNNFRLPHPLINTLSVAPLDLPTRVSRFFSTGNPDLVLISQHSVWPCMLSYFHMHKIPYFFIGARLHQSTLAKKIYFSVMSEFYQKAHTVYLASITGSVFNLADNRIQIKAFGDPRLTSIIADREAIKTPFQTVKKYILLASIHKEDFAVIKWVYMNLKNETVFIVPHEPTSEMRDFLRSRIPELKDWSEKVEDPGPGYIYVSRKGILKYLYAQAKWAYIGGGFDKGIHNLLEALVYFVPVITGPRHRRFPDTELFISIGAVRILRKVTEMPALLSQINSKKIKKASMLALEKYYESNRCAAELIAQDILSQLNLLNEEAYPA